MRHVHRLPTAMVVAVAACALLTHERGLGAEADTPTVVFASESQPSFDLNLEIGDLTQILTAEQLEQALGMDIRRLSGVETPVDEQMEQIEVRAAREQHSEMTANIGFGFASLAWAFQHPAEAWRIFLPVELEG